jgi:hypothetical protein
MSSVHSVHLETYKHKPLSPGRNIRTLVLQPDRKHDAPIHIALEEQPLYERGQKPGNYEALSYVWGKQQSEPTSVTCDGKIIPVTPNCLAALTFLRLQSQSRRLWIDAVCIDQTSVDEKGHQVKLMGDVYACASQTLIWLGHGDPTIVDMMQHISVFGRFLPLNPFKDYTDLRLETTKRMIQVSEPCHKLLKAVFPSPDNRRDIVDSSSSSPGQQNSSAETISGKAFESLYGNEWLERAWTFQEICYSPVASVLYENTSVPWDTFYQYHDGYSNPTLSIDKYSLMLSDITVMRKKISNSESLKNRKQSISLDKWQQESLAHDLATVLYSAQRRKATNSCDHVYAYHQLLSDIGFDLKDPDYEVDILKLLKTPHLLSCNKQSLQERLNL